MSSLTKNWLTENHIDFEYKKYVVLAYLQDVQQSYKQNELYPCLAEVIEHYRNLKQLKENSERIKKGLLKELKGIDSQKMELLYAKMETGNDELIQELEQIIDFSIPLFFDKIMDGKKIYDFVEKHLSLNSVGITPLRTTEGYIFISEDEKKEVHVYQYSLSNLESAQEHLRQLITRYIDTYAHTITGTFEKIKTDLISTRKELPNPAVYAINSPISVPFSPTLLPIVKRFFVSKLAA
ncbi:MAG TPA: hypothetical protein VNZ49_17485 [Bacteroidia bacterium]|jgi:hypothetical protein|nr:hypothetical protein [Bacteroidia bacterium]